MNLLIIDDEIETINGIMTGMCWNKLAFQNIYKAVCVEQAKAVFGKRHVDVALCDIEMPDGSGLDLIEWVRENYSDTVCLILTCHEEFYYAKRAVSLQCKDYILKPVIYGELEKKLLQIQEQIQKEREDNRYQKFGRDWVRQINHQNMEADSYLSKTELVDVVKSYVRTHLKDEIRMDELAKMTYVSQDYMGRVFKRAEGITISDFILEERMFLAQELLKEDKLSISRVAYECGYDNYSYFTKVFRKKYLMTPREYRQNFLGNQKNVKENG